MQFCIIMIKNVNYSLSKLITIGILVLILALVLALTDPAMIALPVLVAPFLLIGLILYQVTTLIVYKNKKRHILYKSRLFPLSIAFLGVALLILRSLHQLTMKDSFLVSGFTIAFWVYIWRADFLHK